jgi:hypothetical protein
MRLPPLLVLMLLVLQRGQLVVVRAGCSVMPSQEVLQLLLVLL